MSLKTAPAPAPDRTEFTLHLIAEKASIILTRKLTEWALRSWGLASVADMSVLVMSELATNSCRAAPGRPMWVRVSRQHGGALIECWDSSPEIPTETDLVDPTAEGGRGLWIVGAVSAKHGITETPETGGKTIWALCAPDLYEAGA
jgi:hypothetical protein